MNTIEQTQRFIVPTAFTAKTEILNQECNDTFEHQIVSPLKIFTSGKVKLLPSQELALNPYEIEKLLTHTEDKLDLKEEKCSIENEQDIRAFLKNAYLKADAQNR